jgi:hypothetical protein
MRLIYGNEKAQGFAFLISLPGPVQMNFFGTIQPQPTPILRAGFDQRLAQGGENPGERNRLTRFGPGLAVHADEELAGGEWSRAQEDFEIFIFSMILDGNSQVGFHNL